MLAAKTRPEEPALTVEPFIIAALPAIVIVVPLTTTSPEWIGNWDAVKTWNPIVNIVVGRWLQSPGSPGSPDSDL